ncbi:MAG TPA: Fe-Mn family superoxide dismutase [Planctomycetaceae bacterium]|nr:Fe-Mn family superoxide dismutase [Planctomycetaceae bacterium]
MSRLSRRSFVFVSSGAVAGNFLASGLAVADEAHAGALADSGLVTGALKPLRHASIPGFLSAEQIAPHHTAHYGGALRAFNSIEARFEDSFQTGTPIDPLAYDAMQRTKSSRGNSVILHELYFDGMAPRGADPEADVRQAIHKRFGSLEKWADDFQASARSAAGWAMLVLHPVNGRLYNVLSDEHAQGPLWMAVPLVVIDVYEHAFYIDYQNRKAEYVQKFMAHIDWAEANRRYHAATQA